MPASPSTGSASAIRAGKALVEVGGDVSPLAKALASASGLVKGLGEKLKGLGKFSLLSGGLAATGLVAGFETLKGLMDGFSDRAKDIKTISTVLGVSAEEASKLAFAFKEAGMDADELLHIGVKLQKELVDAAQKGGGVFEELGLDAKKLAAEPVDQAMSEIAKSIMGIQNATVRNFAGEEIFGKRWPEVAKLFAKGIDEAKKRAEEFGFVMTQEMIDKAADSSKSMKAMGFLFESVFQQIGAALMPSKGALGDFVENVKTGTSGIRTFLAGNQGAIKILGGLGLATVAASASLLILGKTVGLVGAGLSIAFIPFKIGIGLIGTLVSTLPLLLTPIGLIAAAVTGLGAVWATQTESGKFFAGELGELFTGLAATAKTAWGGIVNAVKAGDLELAGKIAFKGLQLAWLQTTEFLTKYWNAFKDIFLDGWRDIVTFIAKGLAQFPSFFEVLADVEKAVGMDDARDRNAAEMLREDPGAVMGQLNQMRQEQQKASRIARDKDLQNIRDEIAALQGQLNAGVGEANAKIEQKGIQDRIQKEIQRAQDAIKPTIADIAKGGFSAERAQGEFAFGSELKQSLILQERNAKAAEEGVAKLKAISDVLQAMGLFRFA